MYQYLDSIHSPEDVAKLKERELELLAGEIREFLIENVSRTGGHLASNLGVVELTLALLKTFSPPRDKIIFDVGHQSYVYKILTGRAGEFHTLRQKGGLSGFPKREESIYDCFNTGHSSTSISAAAGMACARDLRKENYSVVAVIGDGAIGGGMAFEALNDAGMLETNLIVILNDNEMSIAENVGAMSRYFRRISTNKGYFRLKRSLERFLNGVPYLGKRILKLLRKMKSRLKSLLFTPTIFDEMGFAYTGPIDGHNIRLLCKNMERARDIGRPVFIHIHTKKGKGYPYAEEFPSAYHGVSRFDADMGVSLQSMSAPCYSRVFGNTLISLAKAHQFSVITPAMKDGSGLSEFAELYPKRFFDVGIAEQHAVTFGAGLAANGEPCVVSLYSTFMQRAYDQILHDVCLMNLHVVFALDRAGAVGGDGETHQGIYDIPLLTQMPNMSMLAPASMAELPGMLEYALLRHNGPIAVRYPRGKAGAAFEVQNLDNRRAQVLAEGEDVCIFTVGVMAAEGLEARRILQADGITACVVHLRWIKPLDRETILACAKGKKLCLCAEDGVLRGGVGEEIATVIHDSEPVPVLLAGYPDCVIAQATAEEIHAEYGLTGQKLAEQVLKKLEKDIGSELI